MGTIAAQPPVGRGITVVATAGAADIECLSGLGATAVRSGEGWVERVRAAPGGVDAVFGTTGAGLPGDAAALAGDADRVTTIADHHAAEHGVRFTGADPEDRFPEAFPDLAGMMAGGKLSVPACRSYPLAEAAKAQADLEARRNHSKLILLP